MGRVGRRCRGLAGLRVLAIGGVCATVGFAIGHVVTQRV
jgi:hypothetical protein